MRTVTIPHITPVLLLIVVVGCYRTPNVKSQSSTTPAGNKRSFSARELPYWSVAKRAQWEPSDFFDSENELRICEAISTGNIDELVALLEPGVELNAQGRFGVTVLYWSFFVENLPAFELLLEHGADPDLRLNDEFEEARMYIHLAPDESVLFTSLRFNKGRFFEAAFKYTSDAHQLDNKGANLLHAYLSAEFSNQQTLKSIIDSGLDLSAKAPGGSTPCHLALFQLRPHLCVQLLEAGADPSVHNSAGRDVADAVEYYLGGLSRTGRSYEHFAPLVTWLNENYREIREP